MLGPRHTLQSSVLSTPAPPRPAPDPHLRPCSPPSRAQELGGSSLPAPSAPPLSAELRPSVDFPALPACPCTLQHQRLVSSANNPQCILGRSLGLLEDWFPLCANLSHLLDVRWRSCPFGSFFPSGYEIEETHQRAKDEGVRHPVASGIS